VKKLLISTGVREKERHPTNVVAWQHMNGQGRVFGTTLGHDMKTSQDPHYQQLLANGLLWACDKLDDNGQPKLGYQGPGVLKAHTLEETKERTTRTVFVRRLWCLSSFSRPTCGARLVALSAFALSKRRATRLRHRIASSRSTRIGRAPRAAHPYTHLSRPRGLR